MYVVVELLIMLFYIYFRSRTYFVAGKDLIFFLIYLFQPLRIF